MYRSPSYQGGIYRTPSRDFVVRSPSYQQFGVSRSSSRLGFETPPTRSASYSYGSTVRSPSYAYGTINRSPSVLGYNDPVSRSGSTIFGRTLYRSANYSTPPLHSVAVQRSTPHYSDKYPYVRYSYGSTDTGIGIISQSRQDYTQRYRTTKQYLDDSLSMYGTNRQLTPKYGSSYSYISKHRAPYSSYVRYMPIDDAVDMYKKRCMTASTLSKYWLTPSTWISRREKEHNLGRSTMSTGNYSYASRYTPISYY